MITPDNRRRFLRAGSALLLAPLLGDVAFAQPATQPAVASKKQKLPALESALVRDFVMAAHVDLDKTRTLLDAHPTLLNATWDWSNGDFEMAIGGAGHMGRRDIAQFLIDRGGRYDVFVAAMMGKVEIVRAMLTAFPNLRTSRGPHGIDLMTHAEKGGGEAAEVVKYLRELGG